MKSILFMLFVLFSGEVSAKGGLFKAFGNAMIEGASSEHSEEYYKQRQQEEAKRKAEQEAWLKKQQAEEAAAKKLKEKLLSDDPSKSTIEIFKDGGFQTRSYYVLNGELKVLETFYNGKLHGKYQRFSHTGETLADLTYENGEIVEGIQVITDAIRDTQRYEEMREQPNLKTKFWDVGGSSTMVMTLKKSGEDIFISFACYDKEANQEKTVRYKNDTLDGIQEKYVQGRLYEMVTYVNGIKEGDSISYDYMGRLDSKKTYKNGKEEGLATFYYPDGKLRATVQYKDGLRVSDAHYLASGKVINKREYKDGHLTDGVHRYYEIKDGKETHAYKIETYKDGELNGDYKSYNWENKLQEEGPYQNGKKHGMWKKYSYSHVSRKYELATEGEYQDDKKHGLWKMYKYSYENRKNELATEGEYQNEKKYGVWKTYRQNNGKNYLATETTYNVNEKKDGMEREFDPQTGAVTSITEWKDGTLIAKTKI